MFWQHHMLNRDLDSLASFQTQTHLPRSSPPPPAILKAHPSPTLHFFPLDVLLPLKVPFFVLYASKSFTTFSFFLFKNNLSVHTNKVSPSSPWFHSSPFLNLSHHLIRSRITNACGMVVPMPALCQSAWVCMCVSLSLVGSPWIGGQGGFRAQTLNGVGSGEALWELQLTIQRERKQTFNQSTKLGS